MTINVRKGSQDDQAAVIALWRACDLVSGANDPNAEFKLALGKESSDVLVAVDEKGQVVGSVMVGHDGHRGWLYYVASAPSVRAQGIGRHVVKVAEEWLKERGIFKAQLLVTETNQAVVPFYEQLGFERSPRIVMRKRLYD